MKTNGGLKSVCSSCGDETSRVGEDRSQKKAVRLYIPKIFGITLPRKPDMVRLGMICAQIESRRRLMLKLCS